MMMWLVTANTNSCRIFLYNKRENALTLVKELNNPLGKLKGSELITDRPGRFSANNGGASGAYVGANDPHDVEVDKFALKVARELIAGHNTNQYSKVIISAQDHMGGCINKHLNGHLKDCVTNIRKDYTQLSEKQLLAMLAENHH